MVLGQFMSDTGRPNIFWVQWAELSDFNADLPRLDTLLKDPIPLGESAYR